MTKQDPSILHCVVAKQKNRFGWKAYISLTFFFSLINNIAAQELQKTKTSERVETKVLTDLYPLMYQMLNELSALQPFMVNKQKFESQQNKTEITRRLTDLSRISEKVMVQKSLSGPGYYVSGEALNQQIQNTKKTFLKGNTEYARWALSSIPLACASCHSQQASNAKPLWQLTSKDLSGNEVDRAEFLFSTRNYDPAERAYTQVIRTFHGNSGPPDRFQDAGDVENALKRKLTIWIRVWRNLKGAKSSLELDLKNRNIPADDRQLMNRWIKQIDTISKSASKEQLLKGEALLKLARQQVPASTGAFMSGIHANLVHYLWISGLLYNRLNTSHDKKLIPEYLYWLAQIDFGLNNDFFFSLGSTYLRDCILKYPHTAITFKCYKQYELQIAQLYTGTRGTDIPSEVMEDLKQLKAIANGIRN